MLNIQDDAPYFEVSNQNNQIISLNDFKGKFLVLYFYPKDNTPGCTRESVAFSSLKSEFESNNTVILGVSKDSVKSHHNFCQKQNLEIDLLSDESTEMIQAYGVWQEKKNYGKTYMGIVRSTYIIDPAGKVLKVWKNVKVDGHAEAVLEVLKSFQ